MKIVVSKDIVKIENNHSENHYGEYNVNECTFQFDDYFNNVSVKRAIFTSRINNKSIEVDIINNKCMVPSEILKNVYDEVTLGVYGYELSGEELLVRYSPTPDKFVVHDGSYKENAEHPEIITPTQYDIYSQALQEGLSKVDDKLVDVEKQGDYANTQGNYAKEQGDYAKEQGTNAKNVAEETEKKAEEGKFNGKSLEFIWQGTKLGVRLEGQEEYQFVDLQGVQGEIGATGEPFKIKKTYASVSEMNADFRNMEFGDYVMIASSVDVEDNAKLYTRGESAWIFISDFSGAMGIRGETGLTPNIKIGEVKTLEAGSQAKVTRSGSNEEPVFNFELPKGDKGDDYVLTDEDKVEIGEKVNTEYEKRIAENEKDIIDIESYLDSLTPKNNAKGELVHITDALGLPVFENKIDGNVKQETTKGQQLYNFKDTKIVSSGITVDENDWITATFDNTNGTSSKYLNYWTNISNKLKPSTNYKIVLEVKNISGTLTDITVVSRKTGDMSQFSKQQYFNFGNLTSNSVQVLDNTTLDDFTNSIYMLRSYITFGAGKSGSITFRLSVIEDTTVTPETFVYEPYTGGQASPNPEFPQEVEVLEGYNLLPFTNQDFTLKGVHYYVQNGSLYLDGTSVGETNTNGQEFKDNFSFILPAGTYYFSRKNYNGATYLKKYSDDSDLVTNQGIIVLNEDTQVYIGLYIYQRIFTNQKIELLLVKGDKDKPYLPYGCVGYKVNGKNLCKDYSGYKAITDGIKANTTFTISFDVIKKMTDYVYLHDVNGTYKENFSSTILDVGHHSKTFTLSYVFGFFRNYGTREEITNVQIEIGQETPYEPYQEQIVPLDLKGNWVGNVRNITKDYLVTDKKRLWLVKNIRHLSLKISDMSDSESYPAIIAPTLYEDFPNKNIPLLYDTTRYISNITNNTYAFGLNSMSQNSQLIFNKNIFGLTGVEWKTKYPDLTVELYYALPKPQIIELGELPEPIKTFEGINNIQVLANLDTEIEVKYALDIKKYTDNKLAEISAQII